MYKVFINNKCIFLSDGTENFSDRAGRNLQYSSESLLLQKIDEFEKDRSMDNLYVSGNPDLIVSLFPMIEAAGGLVRKDSDQILFIFRYGKWDLPKGKMEPGEKPNETAIREVMEETGIAGLTIKKELEPTYHTYRLDGKRVIKKTHWFEMSYSDDTHITPQTLEDITVVKWLSKKDIPWMMRDSYASIVELLTSSGYL
jgi:8-oxo-dGTP pyrophosphatase MutT (NUDIX family)